MNETQKILGDIYKQVQSDYKIVDLLAKCAGKKYSQFTVRSNRIGAANSELVEMQDACRKVQTYLQRMAECEKVVLKELKLKRKKNG